jgi:hypothetical protein
VTPTRRALCLCKSPICPCVLCHGTGLAESLDSSGGQISGANIFEQMEPCDCGLGRQFDAQFADNRHPKPCVDCGAARTPASLSATRCDECDRAFVKASRGSRPVTSDDVLASMVPAPPESQATAASDIAWLQAKLDASLARKPRTQRAPVMKALAPVEEITPEAQAALAAWRAKWQAPEATPINPQ